MDGKNCELNWLGQGRYGGALEVFLEIVTGYQGIWTVLLCDSAIHPTLWFSFMVIYCNLNHIHRGGAYEVCQRNRKNIHHIYSGAAAG